MFQMQREDAIKTGSSITAAPESRREAEPGEHSILLPAGKVTDLSSGRTQPAHFILPL